MDVGTFLPVKKSSALRKLATPLPRLPIVVHSDLKFRYGRFNVSGLRQVVDEVNSEDLLNILSRCRRDRVATFLQTGRDQFSINGAPSRSKRAKENDAVGDVLQVPGSLARIM